MLPPQVEAQLFGILIVTLLIFAVMWHFCGKCPLAVDSWDEFGDCLWNGVKGLTKLMINLMTWTFRALLGILGIKL